MLAIAAAGCGETGGVVDRDSFARDAGRICVQGNDDAFDLNEEIERAQQQEDVAEIYRDLARSTRRAVRTARPYLDRLDALEAPRGDADEIATWIADQRRRLVLLEDLAKAFDAEDDRASAAAGTALGDLEDRTSEFARDYGMAECAAAR